MKFGIVNGEKVEPYPKAKGVCPHCDSEIIARCGKVKVWHWAHKRTSHCDHWWESETEWHREWKSHFPNEWQEISHVDSETGEKHIADVKNPFGLVIEFQHSPIKDEERISREEFYKSMIWVVDGRNHKNNFYIGLDGRPLQKSPLAFQINWYGRSRIFHNWGESQVKVFLDLGEDILWRLVKFDVIKKIGVVGFLPKKVFVDDCLKGINIHVTELKDDSENEKTHNNS